MARLVLMFVVLPLCGCGPPSCPPVPVSLPETTTSLPWTAASKPRVEAQLGSSPVTALLDTGFPQSAVALTFASGLDLARVPVQVGGVTAGPLPFGLIVDPSLDTQAVLGGDVLHQLPLAIDARARTVEIAPRFAPPSLGGVPLDVWSTGRCRDDDTSHGPEGPHALLVDGELDGQRLRFLLDTGADASFVRTAVVAALDPRPMLSNVRVATGFSGPFFATATRARALSVGSTTSLASLVLTGDPVDAELDRLLARYGGRRCAGGSGCPERLDGFLGWSFLREFRVGLTEGRGPTRGRALRLERFDTQTHWTREFIGIGIYTTPSADPVGARIAGFLSVSPARDAQLQEGDVIVTVDGVPVANAPSPYAAPGQTVNLDVVRDGQHRLVQVEIRDLLPDPP